MVAAAGLGLLVLLAVGPMTTDQTAAVVGNLASVRPLPAEQAVRINERIAGVESDLLHASEVLEEIQGEWALPALVHARGSVEAARDALTAVFAAGKA